MKRFLKVIGLIVLSLVLIAFATIWALQKERPTGVSGDRAEILAKQMLDAVDQEAWKNTRYVQWSFFENHHYLWDKNRNIVHVNWKDYDVYLNTLTDEGRVFKNDVEITNSNAEIWKNKARKYFNNDSFWLCAPFKILDSGTERKLVLNEDKTESLMVTYKTGGTTPGDSYLWHLDANGKPKSVQMWAQVIPVGGLEYSWENWKTLNGFEVAVSHEIYGFDLPIENLAAGNTLEELSFAGEFTMATSIL